MSLANPRQCFRGVTSIGWNVLLECLFPQWEWVICLGEQIPILLAPSRPQHSDRMAKKAKPSDIFLQWTELVPTADVQDPLGTSLRGSTRLANRLLFCITSITPRARYFSFIPWCVQDYQKREQDKGYAPGLRQGIQFREHALTLGCVAHHGGVACVGGALVGSDNAIMWFHAHKNGQINFKRTSFVKVPALDAYFNSLVNLGLFVTEEELPELSDENEEPPPMTFDDVELTELGKQLASRYDSAVGGLKAISEISSRQRKCSVNLLKSLGKRGGLCELADAKSPDRELLRDLFFCRIDLNGESHPVRRQSLLLLLDLCKQLNDAERSFNANTFADSVYCGMVFDDGDSFNVSIPSKLRDIATRWRMFYFHYYMAVALEGSFSWLVMRLHDAGVRGESLSSLVDATDERLVKSEIGDLLQLDLDGSFGELTPSDLFDPFDVPRGMLTTEVSRTIDTVIRADSLAAEHSLESSIRQRQFTYSSSGIAVPLVLLALTMARYRQWEDTKYGRWFASVASDPYLDLIPPVVLQALNRRFGDWWNASFHDLASFVLPRFIIQQHQSMSYVKSASGNRCVLQVDGSQVCATGTYDKIGISNARFRSAIQVLADLGLLERDDDKEYTITQEGRKLLKSELAAEPKQ